MHSSTFFAFLLPALVYSAAVRRGDEGAYGGNGGGLGGGNCNTGPVQCCNQVQDASNTNLGQLGGLLGLDLGSITGLVGLNCNPISAVVGIGGNSCSSQPVCCTGNHENGLVAVGCSPVNLNL